MNKDKDNKRIDKKLRKMGYPVDPDPKSEKRKHRKSISRQNTYRRFGGNSR